jgi:hypothetical protein
LVQFTKVPTFLIFFIFVGESWAQFDAFGSSQTDAPAASTDGGWANFGDNNADA